MKSLVSSHPPLLILIEVLIWRKRIRIRRPRRPMNCTKMNSSIFAIHVKNSFYESLMERKDLEALQKDRAAQIEARNEIRQYDNSSK